jgi:hypothetical protein
MTSDEQSPGGSRIIRHGQRAPGGDEVAHADDGRIGKHLDRAHGGEHHVFHEIVSHRVHVDVHALAPTKEHPFWLLATSGMSALPMNVPSGMPDAASWRHAELCILMPPTWTPSEQAFKDERVYWPVRLLKQLARIPHDYSTWLGLGHSIPNGDPAKPYAPGTHLAGAVLIPPILFGDALFVVPGSPTMHILQVLPVTAAEMAFKLERGIDAMGQILDERFPDPYGPVDALRPSAV